MESIRYEGGEYNSLVLDWISQRLRETTSPALIGAYTETVYAGLWHKRNQAIQEGRD